MSGVRSTSTANKLHQCTKCKDPIVPQEVYTTIVEGVGYTGVFRTAAKLCQHCSPIPRVVFDGQEQIVTMPLIRKIMDSAVGSSMHKKREYAANFCGFDCWDAMMQFYKPEIVR